jgi:uncharacterized membrane protein
MGLFVLVLGLVVFLGTHLFVTARQVRAAAVARLGHGYRLLFALVSATGLALIVWGYALYRRTGWIDIWYPPHGMRHIMIALMLVSVILVLAAYLPGHIKTWTGHPMLAGVKIWAFAHLLSNGDLGSMLLFGSFLAWAVYARVSVRRRERNGDISGPRVIDAGWRNDAVAVTLGAVIYIALGYVFHPVVIGVPVFGA